MDPMYIETPYIISHMGFMNIETPYICTYTDRCGKE